MFLRAPQDMISPTIERFMTPAPHTIGFRETLATAHRLMGEHGIRHLPVLESGRLVGIVSQRDLHLIETLRGVNPEEVEVSEAMTPSPYTVSPRASLRRVAAEMALHKYGSAVVLEKARVVGVFTPSMPCGLSSPSSARADARPRNDGSAAPAGWFDGRAPDRDAPAASHRSVERRSGAAGVTEARHWFGEQPGLPQRPTTRFTDTERSPGEPVQRRIDLLDFLAGALASSSRRVLTEKPISEPEEANADDALEGSHGRTTRAQVAITGPGIRRGAVRWMAQRLRTRRLGGAAPASLSGPGAGPGTPPLLGLTILDAASHGAASRWRGRSPGPARCPAPWW